MIIMKYMDNVQTDLKDFNKLHPNRKLAIFGIILFVFVVSILVGIYFTQNKGTLLNETPVEEIQAGTNLSMVTSSDSVAVGETVTVSVLLEGEAVQAVDVAINYDPNVFTATEVTNGNVYESIVREELSEGQVSITAAVSPSDPTNFATGELFSFTLEAVGAGSSELQFDPELTITAKNGDNTLQNTQGVTITAQ